MGQKQVYEGNHISELCAFQQDEVGFFSLKAFKVIGTALIQK